MIPSFAVDLHIIFRQLTSLVAKNKIVPDASTTYLLLQLDLGKNENLSDIDKVEFGSTVTFSLANLKVKEEIILKFWKDVLPLFWNRLQRSRRDATWNTLL